MPAHNVATTPRPTHQRPRRRREGEGMRTLDDARKIEKEYPNSIRIEVETKYYAVDQHGVRYPLIHDWTLEQLNKKFWMKRKSP